MIIEEYDESLFISRFEDYKRVINDKWKGGNFTYKGLRALFLYLDEAHDEENPLKLDVISLCCDFSEYKDLEEYLRDYSNQHKTQISFNTFIKREYPKLLKEYEIYKKGYVKNGLDLSQNLFIWVGCIKKKEDIINQFNEFKKVIENEINEKTTLIKFEDDLNEGFIIAQY